MKILKRCLSVLLCAVIIFTVCDIAVKPKALAAELTVAGGAILLTGLLACGIAYTSEKPISEVAKAVWQSTTDAVRNKVKQIEATGLAIKANGTLAAHWAADQWHTLTDWVKEKFTAETTTEEITIQSEAQTITSVTVNGSEIALPVPFASVLVYSRSGGYGLVGSTVKTIYATDYTGGLQFKTQGSQTLARYNYTSSTGQWASTNGWTMYQTDGGQYGYYGQAGYHIETSISYRTVLYSSFPITKTYDNTVVQRPADVSSFPDVIGLTAHKNPDYSLDGGVMSPPVSIPAGGSIGVTIPTTYDEATGQDVINLGRVGELSPADVRTTVSDVVIPADQTLVESKDIAISDTTVGDITTENTDSDNTANKLKLPSIAVTKFPFCIPYDLKNAIETLAAPSATPYFEIPFNIPKLNINHTIVIDFAQFETVAAVCRWFLSALWVIVLILMSRKLIFA